MNKQNSTFGQRAQQSLDNLMGGSRIGAEARDQRNANRQNQRFEQADNSATETNAANLVVTGHLQHLNYRPIEGIAELPLDEQAKLFDANFGTKAEGDPRLLERLAFEKIKSAGEKQLDGFRTSPDEYQIDNVREIATPGTVKKFDVRKAFDRAEIDKFVNLDATQPGRWEMGHLEDDLGANIKNLFEGIYGDRLSTHIDNLIAERLVIPGGDSQALHDLIKGILDPNTVAPTNEAELRQIVSESIKIAMLRNPDKAGQIIKAIAKNTGIDLYKIDDFKNILIERTLRFAVDKIASEKPAYFNPADVAAPTVAQVKANRLAIYNQLKVGAGGGVLAININNPAGPTPLNITCMHAHPNFGLLNAPTLKLSRLATPFPAGATKAAAISSYKTNIYQGLVPRFANPNAKAFVKDLGFAMTKNQTDSKSIFNTLFVNALTIGSDNTKSRLERLEALAKGFKFVQDKKGSAAPNSYDGIEKTLENMSTPDKIMENTQKALLENIHATLSTLVPLPAELASLNLPELKDAIELALQGKHVDTQLLERISIIAAGVNDETKRKDIFSNLRAVANLEVIREIAIRSAGSDSDPKYQQYLMALMNRFVFRDSGNPATPSTPEQLTQQLLDLLYAKGNDNVALTINIQSDPKLKSYLQALLPAGAVIESKLELKGLASSGEIYAKAHELFGIIRRGVEAAEIQALSTATDPEKLTYLQNNYGLTAGTPEIAAALTRLNEILSASTDASVHIPELLNAASANNPTAYGLKYTNMLRMFRHYIENGGNLVEIMRNAESLQANEFIKSIQSQANAQTGVAAGGVLADANRVLTVEEQRAAILENYDQLNAERSGLKGWISRIKRVLPRIGKGLAFMALGFAGAMVPAVAGPLAIGFAVMRIAGVIGVFKTGIPLFKKAWADGNWKAGLAAGLAIGVNTAVNLLVPTPFGLGLTLIGESLGMELYTDRKLLKEVDQVRAAHATYETAMGNKLTSLNPANNADMAYLEKLARSINAPVVRNPAGQIDTGATVTNIITARNQAHADKNMTILRSFSQVMEERMSAEVQVLNTENLKARKMYDDTQQTIMSYAIASSATKLGFGIARGVAQGAERAGLFGAIAGGFGWAVGGSENQDSNNPNETDGVDSEHLSQIHGQLEKGFDNHAQELGIPHNENNVIGLIEDGSGNHFAMIDLDNNPKDLEALVEVDNLDLNNPEKAVLDFSNQTLAHVSSSDTETFKEQVALISGSNMGSVSISAPPAGSNGSIVSVASVNGTHFALVSDSSGDGHIYHASITEVSQPIGGGTTESGSNGIQNLETIVTVADDSDSQWSLIEKTLRQAYPGLDDQVYYRATANAIQEATPAEVYQQIYEHRDLSVVPGSAVQRNDQITLGDIKEMAPKTFDKIEQTAGVSYSDGTTTVVSPNGGDVIGHPEVNLLGEPLNPAVSTPNGIIIFDPSGNGAHLMSGNFTAIDDTTNSQTGGGNSAGGTGAATDDDTTKDSATNRESWLQKEWAIFTGALANDSNTDQAENSSSGNTAAGGSSNETQPNNDSFKVVDSGIFDKDFNVFENTVAKIVIPQGYDGAPPFEIDPSQVDVIKVDPNRGVTYITSDGVEHFAAATNGVQFAFVGNESNLVDASSSQQTILSHINEASSSIASGAQNIGETANDVADNLNSTNQSVNEIYNEVGRGIDSVQETIADTGDVLHSGGHAIYDPGFTDSSSAILTNQGPLNEPIFLTDNNLPAWLEAVAITSSDGNHIVPLENVVKMGENFVEYKDIATNEIVRYEGANVVGVGYQYITNASGTPVFDTSKPLTFDFKPSDPLHPNVESVQAPWWNDAVIDLLPQ